MSVEHSSTFRLSIPGTSRVFTFSRYEPSSSTLSETPAQFGKHGRKWRYALLGLAGVITLLLYASNPLADRRTHTLHPPIENGDPGGYFAEDGSFLADLGPEAERVYNLGVTDPAEYLAQMKSFINSGFPVRYRKKLQGSLDLYFPADTKSTQLPDTLPKGILYHKFIHQTDKKEDGGEMSQAWRDMNEADGWRHVFYDDERADTWISRQLRNSDVAWAWHALRRGVLQADFFRYLVVLVQGGLYSDVDTRPLKPINEWGNVGLQLHDISTTDGPAWWTKIAAQPSVVVGIDVDVHEFVGWGKNWPRPLGICQWTLGGSANHPIYIDAVRRILNATHYIEDYIEGIPQRIAHLEEEKLPNWKNDVKSLKSQMDSGKGILPVMEHTGPGIWTDAVLAYLKARYNVTWHDLRGLQTPLRIGEIMVLPITAFSPGGEPDFRSKGQDDPQAAVYHDFRGSWKKEGD